MSACQGDSANIQAIYEPRIKYFTDQMDEKLNEVDILKNALSMAPHVAFDKNISNTIELLVVIKEEKNWQQNFTY